MKRGNGAWRVLLGALALTACADPRNGDPCANAACDAGEHDAGDDASEISDASDAPDGNDGHDAGDGPDAGDVLDAAMDAPRDTTADALDATADVRVDATDSTLDAPRDTTADALDATTDAPADTTDATMDAPRDTAADALDATTDAPRDTAADTTDAATDAPRVDVATDTGPATGGCVSGATGTWVARARWTGSGSGSRATVSYEVNTLPDASRWRMSAYGRSIGYTPVFSDVFLGAGGLELGSSNFIDVELSTAGIASLAGVTLALYGRSYNTTASGSFAWQTALGTGAAPSGLVANSAPYQWYRADISRVIRTGDGGLLLRITAGPPSGALVVNRVEICFDGR